MAILALSTIGESFLIGGIVGIATGGGNYLVVLRYAFGEAALHVEAVAHAVVHIVEHAEALLIGTSREA